MTEIFTTSTFFALALSLLAYEGGLYLRKKTGLSVFNPLLLAIVTVIAFLIFLHIEYAVYEEGSRILKEMLTPATVSLAIPLYRQLEILKKNSAAILAGVLAGVITSMVSALGLALLFSLSHEEYVTLLPKSITTAIGMGMSEELGGVVTITVAVIVVTGIVGNIMGEILCRLFRIREKIAVGLALGTAAHAIGTAKALELGEIQGAMGSLAIVAAGLFTVIGANIFALLY